MAKTPQTLYYSAILYGPYIHISGGRTNRVGILFLTEEAAREDAKGRIPLFLEHFVDTPYAVKEDEVAISVNDFWLASEL